MSISCTSATQLSGIARTDGRLHSRRGNTRASCIQDRLDTSDRSDVRCPGREPLETAARATRMHGIDGNAPLFSHPQYKSHVANFIKSATYTPENTVTLAVHASMVLGMRRCPVYSSGVWNRGVPLEHVCLYDIIFTMFLLIVLQSVCGTANNLKNLGRPSEKCASTLKNLFPVTSNKKRKFDPTGACVSTDARRKKKAASTRIRPKKVSVVLLEAMPPYVPKGHARAKLMKTGLIKQISFCRNMSNIEVRDILVKEFSKVDQVQTAQFLRCEPSNVMCLNPNQELDGDGVIELAGQGSLYLTLKPVKVRVIFIIIMLTNAT